MCYPAAMPLSVLHLQRKTNRIVTSNPDAEICLTRTVPVGHVRLHNQTEQLERLLIFYLFIIVVCSDNKLCCSQSVQCERVFITISAASCLLLVSGLMSSEAAGCGTQIRFLERKQVRAKLRNFPGSGSSHVSTRFALTDQTGSI